jgi:hypothetical protein
VVNFFSSPSESLSKIGGWISSAFTFGESEKIPDQSKINNSILNLEINTNLILNYPTNNKVFKWNCYNIFFLIKDKKFLD